MADPACHYCDRLAEAECATCGRLYCSEHGADVCLRCMAPESAAPTPTVFRGSLVALGLASAVAIFLIVSPPEDAAMQDEPRPISTNTPAFLATATPTPANNGADDGDVQPTTVVASPTPADGDPTTTPTPDGPGQTTYTVQPGDSLSGIAVQHGVSVEDIVAANPDISDPGSIILPGQEIIIPAP